VTLELAVLPIEALPPGSVRSVGVAGRRLCLANDGGAVFALDDQCLHRGGSLGDGRLSNGLVSCPLHWWRYDVRTGALCGRPSGTVSTFPTRVHDGQVLVTLPPAAQRSSLHDQLRAHARTGTPGPHAGSAARIRRGGEPAGEPR
jgi:nitrite reductase (NADH) small subunit